MQALVKFGDREEDIAIQEVPQPELQPDQVLIEVKAAGVCGSDLHMWRQRHSWPIKLPLILGHEFAGVIAGVGERVRGFWPGERVTCETAASVCGECAYCRSGIYNLCPQRKGYGALVDGGFAQYVAARPQILHRLPDAVPFEHAAITEPVCVAYNALVEKAVIRPGDTVVILGPGPIGILALQIARLRGASYLIVVGTRGDSHRLAIARQLGALRTFVTPEEDVAAFIRTHGDGLGADVVVDCTGVSHALRQALDIVRPNGRIVKIGWGPQPLDFNLDLLVAKAVTLQGSFSHNYPIWERALMLMASGQIDLTPVIGGVYPFSQWQQAFSAMESGIHVKSVLTMETER